jgi:methyl-accepting chemotaxis protein
MSIRKRLILTFFICLCITLASIAFVVFSSARESSDGIRESAGEFSALAGHTNASAENFRASVENIDANLSPLALTGEEVNESVREVAAGAKATAEKGSDICRPALDVFLTKHFGAMKAFSSVFTAPARQISTGDS